MTDRLLTPGDTATMLGVHVGTLAKWRARKTGPRYVVLSSGLVRYRLRSVLDWIDVREIEPSSRRPLRGRLVGLPLPAADTTAPSAAVPTADSLDPCTRRPPRAAAEGAES